MSTHQARGLGLVSVCLVTVCWIAGTFFFFIHRHDSSRRNAAVTIHRASHFDRSRPLAELRTFLIDDREPPCGKRTAAGCGTAPAEFEEGEPDGQRTPSEPEPEAPDAHKSAPDAGVEQNAQGSRPPAATIASFDGLGFGFSGPQGQFAGGNPSDNSLATGPNHIVQIVNSRMAVFTKKGDRFDITGRVLYGPVVTNKIFAGFGGQCEHRISGDAVVRYDQLANRWLYVLPVFRRPPDDPKGPYSMCYAVSVGADPLGPYYRYEFKRPLFPDYPRPAVWPDGYYIPTSTGDRVIQKHACVADRNKMLKGLPATEQCVIVDGVNFLNNTDLDGQCLPPPGAPNIVMAAGGTQLHKRFEDDGIYAYKFHVDWENPSNTKLSDVIKIKVAPYHYLCNGQLTSCVPQPNTTRRLDAQGDKLMQRLVYRNSGDHQSIVALHSINSKAGAGGVRWYEFRLDKNSDPYLYQQGTYAPDNFYRWMGSIAMDRLGDIGIGYSFGGTPEYAGQRFAARLFNDPPGKLTFHETVLAEGAASQTNTLRWEDYATTAMDPTDDCTFWYVGDYLKAGASSYTSRIGAFRLPGCLTAKVSGTVFFDVNHNGHQDPGEPGLAGRHVSFRGSQTGNLITNASGDFSTVLPSDPVYENTAYSFSLPDKRERNWISTTKPEAAHSLSLDGPHPVEGVNFGRACLNKNRGARNVKFWSGHGKAVLLSHGKAWHSLVNSGLYLVNDDGSRFAVGDNGTDFQQLHDWLRASSLTNASKLLSTQLAVVGFNTNFGTQDGNATIQDPIAGDWPAIAELTHRVSSFLAAHPNTSAPGEPRNQALKYEMLLNHLNKNSIMITPSRPDDCK